MSRPEVNTAPLLVVIADDDAHLGRAIAMSLLEDKRRLHEKFNGSKMPPWQAMTNHLDGVVTSDEITASIDDVLNSNKRFMMILSGYKNTPEWNDALTAFMSKNRVSATFIRAEGEAPPGPVRALFNAYTELPDEAEADPVDLARVAIKMARHHSSIPGDEMHRLLH